MATTIAPGVVLTRLLLAHPSTEAAERAIDDALRRAANADSRDADEERQGLLAARQLLRANRERCEWITQVGRTGLDTAEGAASADDVIGRCERLFDWAVEQSEEGSVAAYTLGDPGLFALATAEVVAELAALGVLGRDRDTLEIGCGVGRMQYALASLVRQAHGVDISARMIAAARRRCAGMANVHFERCSGRDLASLDTHRFHLVYAIDSFPYIQRAGWAAVQRYMADIARVLAPGGDVVLFNYSYRGDLDADRRDIAALARAGGFDVRVNGEARLRTWDGVLFHLRHGLPSQPVASPSSAS